jgi:hypothetical protein
MASVPIDESQLSDDSQDLFDKLKLDTNEYARLTLPTDQAECQWVHNMRAPDFDHDVPVKEVKKRRGGGTYDDYATVFVGQRICLGDPEVVSKAGLDPDGCPACRSAKDGTKDMAPERRYAVPVIRYETKSKGSVELRPQVGAKMYVWALTWRMWDQLIKVRSQIRELYGWPSDKPVQMKHADIVLFCEDGGWQRVRIEMPRRPAWAAKDETGKQARDLVTALWADEAGRPTEAQLRAACGRAGDREWMVIDVEDVEAAWRKVRAHENGERPPAPGADRGGSLAEGLDELDADVLLGTGEPGPGGTEEFAPKTAAAPANAGAADGDDSPEAASTAADGDDSPFGDDLPEAVTAAAEVDDPFSDDTPADAAPAAPAAARQPAAVAANGAAPAAEGESFDSIMDELDGL